MERDHHAGFGQTGPEAGTYRRQFNKRNVTDYGSSMVQWMRHRRPRYQGGAAIEVERPTLSYIVDMIPSIARPGKAVDAVPAKMLHSSLNKIKHPVNVVKWTPEGRRILTGSSSGEFTLWNGMAFNFETILQAHDSAIRAAIYSHNEDWLISADQDGVVKYWQTNFNNVKVLQAHTDSVRDMAFSPNDDKFVTACDDHTLNIFDFAGGVKESSLTGHGWDVKTVDWHPTKGLLVSGSKDHLVKLWDPRTGRCLTTLHGHKNTIARARFEPKQGQLLATCARDQTARVFDLRMMRDICLLRGHEKDISTLTWHPHHTSLLSTGGADGSIFHYLLDEPHTPAGTQTTIPPHDSADPANAPAQTIFPAHKIQYAHDFSVWSLDWHPLGHILASGSNDRVTRFWTRARPGEVDCFDDRFHLGEDEAAARGTWDKRERRKNMHEDEEQEMEDEAGGLEDQKMPVKPYGLTGIPGLPGLAPSTFNTANGHIRPPSSLLANDLNGLPPIPTGQIPADIASMDPERFKAFMAGGAIPPPPPPPFGGQNGNFPTGPPIPLPQFPPSFDISKFPPGMFPIPPPHSNPSSNIPPLPPGYQPPPGFMSIPPRPPPPSAAAAAAPGLADSFPLNVGTNPDGSSMTGADAGSIRSRGPLPSQQESLMLEQQRGRFKIAR